MNDLVLTVNGNRYSGWESVRVTRSITAATGTFHLSVSDNFADLKGLERIKQDDECVLTYRGEVMINGFVDEVDPSFDEGSRGVTVTGRDRTRDIVDCSAYLEGMEIKDAKLDQAAKMLCGTVGVDVVVGTDVGDAFGTIDFTPNETIFEVLEPRARQRGVLLMPDDRGRLVLGRPSQQRLPVALVQGENLKSGSARYSGSKRFRTYECVGQQPDTDFLGDTAATGTVGRATDQASPRQRLTRFKAEKTATTADCEKRAVWERNIAVARSLNASVTVHGFGYEHQGRFHLWRENRRVYVRSDWLRLDAELLIDSVEYSLDEKGGEVCSLGLVRPWVYTPEPQPTEGEDAEDSLL